MHERRHCSIKIFILAFLAIPAVFAYPIVAGASGNETRPNLPRVVVMKIGSTPSSQVISGMGSISCPKTVELGFDENGIISELRVDEGDAVQEGQVLARLDSEVLEAEKRSTEARLSAARAELKFNQNELEKKENLFSKSAISDTDLRKAALEVEKSKASIDYIQAEIKTAEARLKRRTLNAPMAGLVSEKHVELGSVISPNSNKVVSLISCRDAFAEIELGEKLFAVIQPGMSVRLKVDALEGHAFEGRIIRTAPQIDKKHRTFVAKAVVDNSRWLLRPGMFFRAEIDLTSNKQLLVLIPKSAISGVGTGQPFVFLLKGGLAVKRTVQTGNVRGDKIEILHGLEKGDIIIIDGNKNISDLDEVKAEYVESLPETQ